MRPPGGGASGRAVGRMRDSKNANTGERYCSQGGPGIEWCRGNGTMARCIALLFAFLLASCATAPDVPVDTQTRGRFFDDARFAPASERISAAQVFALSDDMRRYVDKEIAPRTKLRGRQLALVDALYTKGDLKLEYDSAM